MLVFRGNLHLGQAVFSLCRQCLNTGSCKLGLGRFQLDASGNHADLKRPSLKLCRDGLPIGLVSTHEERDSTLHGTASSTNESLGVLLTGDPVLLVFLLEVRGDAGHQGVKDTRSIDHTGGQVFIGELDDIGVKHPGAVRLDV